MKFSGDLLRKILLFILFAILQLPMICYGDKPIGNNFDYPDYNKKLVSSFMKDLKSAVDKGDISTISKMISYPLKTYSSGKVIYIKNEKQFKNKFGIVFNKFIKNVINRYPSEDDAFRPDSGVIINSGAIIIFMVKHKPDRYKIWYIDNELYNLLKDEAKFLK